MNNVSGTTTAGERLENLFVLTDIADEEGDRNGNADHHHKVEHEHCPGRELTHRLSVIMMAASCPRRNHEWEDLPVLSSFAGACLDLRERDSLRGIGRYR